MPSDQPPTPAEPQLVRSITVEIEAPASLVWEILTDLPNYNAWNPHCVRIESTLRLGDPVYMTLVNYTEPGTLMPVVEYLCAFEPQRLLSWEAPWLAEWPYPARRDQVIEKLDDARCRYYSTDAFLGETGIHVMRLAGRWVTRAFDDVARALKIRAEALNAARSCNPPESPREPCSHEHMRDTMLRYAKLLSARDLDGILALFAPDATLEDPVGSTPLRGHAALRQFYLEGFERTEGTMRMKPEGSVRVAGNEAACAMIVSCRVDEQALRVETLDTMVFDHAGRITSMRAHVGPLNFHPESD